MCLSNATCTATARALEKVGPKGKEFGLYSLDYHTIRNFIYVKRNFGGEARAAVGLCKLTPVYP
jgi:hypothetical protein